MKTGHDAERDVIAEIDGLSFNPSNSLESSGQIAAILAEVDFPK